MARSPLLAAGLHAAASYKSSKNLSEKEDLLIVSAWLYISMDLVYGTNQTRGTFWKRVHDFYHKYKDFESGRTQSSISAMAAENVNKFCGCLARIEDRRQSGLVQTLTLFKAEDNEKKSFQFMHCWNQLRNQPKWQEKRRLIDTIKQAPNKKAKANMNSSPGTATPINVDSSNKDIVENACPEADAPKRPIGKKKAKEALRGGMQEIKENELQVKRMLEEKRIMTMYITAMPDQLQQYYESLQADIIARRVPK
ncbi:hypothetical protein BS78_10G196000 [Paspalum vaginatum]|nr:hypothetical protein BS78_10G196000 [Paspalum vaginatum]